MDSKKTQKVVVIILVVTALLGVVGAFFVYNLSVQDRDSGRGQDSQKEYCACITAYTTPTCNDCNCTQIETQTLESSIGEVIDGVCSLSCEATPVEQAEITETVTCLVQQVALDSCHSIGIKDADTRDLIIPPIPTERPILIAGSFVPRIIGGQEEEFTKFSFIINGIATDVDASNVPSTMIDGQKTYLPEIEFSDFENIDTLAVQARSFSDREPDGTAPKRYCHKKYDLLQERGTFCSNMTTFAEEGSGPGTTIVNRLELRTPNLTPDSQISIGFQFDHDDLDPIRTINFTESELEEMLVSETIFFEYNHLYSSPELYSQGSGFPVFNSSTLQATSMRISAQLYINDSPADSNLCFENISLNVIPGEEIEETPPIVTEPEEREEEEEEVEEEEEETPPIEEEEEREDETEVKPDLEMVMEGPTCVNKAAEGEVSRTHYRINVKNNSATQQEIKSITNKLPTGFRYLDKTTAVNKTLIDDSILEITLVGDSQELVWSGNWTIQPNTMLTLEYAVNITHTAIEGENQNEAVIKPTTVPEDMSKLRGEFVTNVSDECIHEEDLPETGYFPILTLSIGLLILTFGILVHQGKVDPVNKVILKVINSKSVKKKLMSPTEYLEDSILEKDD